MGKTLDVEKALEVGRRAHDLMGLHGARLAERVTPEVTESLLHRLRVLEASKSGIPMVRHDAKGATGTERERANEIANAVASLREVLKSRPLTPAERRSWGVGLEVDPGITKSVLAGARAIISAAAAAGPDLSRFGLKQRDVRALEVMVAGLDGADANQRTKKGASKRATSGRDSAIAETFELTYAIGAAGAVEFSPIGSDSTAGEPPLPEVAALFRKLADDSVVPSDRARNKKKPKVEPKS